MDSMAIRVFFPRLLLFLSLIGVTVVPSVAQSDNPLSRKESRELELEKVRETIVVTRERQDALKEEIAALDRDMAAINRALIETSKRGLELETAVTETENRLAKLSQTQASLRSSLNAKSALLSEILGALQRMGRKPPPALLVRPEDAIASLRSAIVLGAVVPDIRGETSVLAGELGKLSETTRKIETENKALVGSLGALAEDETRLTLLIEEKNQLVARSRDDLAVEQKRAEQLASEATTLEGLIASIEKEIASNRKVTRAARDADLKRRDEEAKRLAEARKKLEKAKTGDKRSQRELQSALSPVTGNTGRLKPAVPFSQVKGVLPVPVSGVQLYRFGDQDDLGSRYRNIGYATRASARVVSPADGWIVYAGPFRSYGQLIILDAGEGYHVVLSGMAEIDIETGRFVLAGEPLGRMGSTRVASAVPLKLGSNGPVLYVEFRRNGKPLDPSPWWSAGIEKGPKDDS